MTDLIVQLNFNTGAGDLYCAITQLINFSKKCHDQGFSVGFYYNFHNNQYFFDSNDVSFDTFFEINKQHYKFIKKHNASSHYDGYFYAYTPYLYSRNPEGGLHWWDVFIKNENIQKKDNILKNIVTCCMREWQTEDKISIFPRFSKNVMKLTISNPVKMVGLHIRNLDQSETMELVNNNIEKIDTLINSNLIYLCSNSNSVRNFFSNKENLIMMKPRHENVTYHYGSFKNNANDNKILIENFEDTLAEMHNLSLCEKIYTLTEWNRPTNFLFYARAFNKTMTAENL